MGEFLSILLLRAYFSFTSASTLCNSHLLSILCTSKKVCPTLLGVYFLLCTWKHAFVGRIYFHVLWGAPSDELRLLLIFWIHHETIKFVFFTPCIMFLSHSSLTDDWINSKDDTIVILSYFVNVSRTLVTSFLCSVTLYSRVRPWSPWGLFDFIRMYQITISEFVLWPY